MISADEVLKMIDARLQQLQQIVPVSAALPVEAMTDQGAQIEVLTELREEIEKAINTELEAMATAFEGRPTRSATHALLPLQVGQCPNYREHGYNCGQPVGHEGNCKNEGPFVQSPLRTRCGADGCGEPQYHTASGPVCKNGHGGAPSLDE